MGSNLKLQYCEEILIASLRMFLYLENSKLDNHLSYCHLLPPWRQSLCRVVDLRLFISYRFETENRRRRIKTTSYT
jgi:hypothetical protein